MRLSQTIARPDIIYQPMNKTFIFDFDGILVNNEPLWEIEKPSIYTKCFGPEIAAKLGLTLGSNIEAIHKKATQLGAKVSLADVHNEFVIRAERVYGTAPL